MQLRHDFRPVVPYFPTRKTSISGDLWPIKFWPENGVRNNSKKLLGKAMSHEHCRTLSSKTNSPMLICSLEHVELVKHQSLVCLQKQFVVKIESQILIHAALQRKDAGRYNLQVRIRFDAGLLKL